MREREREREGERERGRGRERERRRGREKERERETEGEGDRGNRTQQTQFFPFNNLTCRRARCSCSFAEDLLNRAPNLEYEAV